MGARKQRGLKPFVCKGLYIETIYWLSIMTICIVRGIVGHSMTVSMCSRWASTERQQFMVLPIPQWNYCMDTTIQCGSIGQLCRWKGNQHAHCPILELNINWASTNLGLASWIITALCNYINPWLQYWSPLWVKMVLTTLLLPPNNEHQQCVNDFWSSILDYQKAMQWY